MVSMLQRAGVNEAQKEGIAEVILSVLGGTKLTALSNQLSNQREVTGGWLVSG